MASAIGRRLADAVAWLGGHFLRRRAAKLALLGAAVAIGLVAYAFNGPFSSEERLIISVSAGFAVVGVMGAYLAYRSWDFARRMSRQAADAEANLRAVMRAVQRHQKELLATDVANDELQRTLSGIQLQQSSVVQALGDNNANWLLLSSRMEQSSSRLESIDAIQREIAGIDAKISHALLASDGATGGLQELAGHLKAFAGALDRTTSQVSVLTSRTDKLSGDVNDVSMRTASLDAAHDQIGLAIARLDETSRSAAQSVDAYRDSDAAAAAALTARLARHEHDLKTLAGSLAKVETELAATGKAQSAAEEIQELTRKFGILHLAFHNLQKGQGQRIEQVEIATASLERLTLSSSQKILQELDLLRQSTGESRAATASLVAGVEQRTALLESSLSFATEQRQTQARQISELEDSLARTTSSQSAAADEFMSQLASLRQFVGEESGRVAELAATHAALRSKVQALETVTVDGGKAIDEIKQRFAGLPDKISDVGREVSQISARIGPLVSSLREAFDKSIADGIAATEALRGEFSDQSRQTAGAIDQQAAAVAELKAGLATAMEDIGSKISALTDRTREISATVEAAAGDLRKRQEEIATSASGVSARLEKVERSVDAEAVELKAAKQGIAHITRKHGDALDEIRTEVAALTERSTKLTSEMEASSTEWRTLQQEVADLASLWTGRHETLQRTFEAGANDLEAAKQGIAHITRKHGDALDEIRTEVAALTERSTKLTSEMEASSTEWRTLQQEAADLASLWTGRHETLERSVEIGASDVEAAKQGIAHVTRKHGAALEEIRSEVAALAARSTALTTALEASSTAWQIRQDELATSASVASGRLDKVETSLLGLDARALQRATEFSKEISSIRDAAASCLARVEVLESSLVSAEKSGATVMEEIRSEVAASAARASARLDKAEGAIATGGKDVESVRQTVADMARTQAAAIEEIKAESARIVDRASANATRFDAAAKELQTWREEITKSASRSSDRLDKVERSVDAGAGEVDVVKRAVADMTRTQAASIESSRKTNELLHEQFKSIREAMTGEFGRVGVLSVRLDALQSSADQNGAAALADMQELRSNLGALSESMAAVISGMDARLADISQRLLETGDTADQADRLIVLDSASWFEPGNRKLRPDHVESVESDWTRRLSIDISRPAIGYMATRINQLERDLDGRLRASIEDTLLRTLVARSVKGPSISVLELGASFGIESAVMYDQLRDHFSKLTFTIVDPLDAFTNDIRLDPQTGLPVSEHILRRNLARAGAPEGCSTLIKRPSADLQALEEAAASTYDMLVIDADHSYAGVKVDFENYARLVKLGGYIVFAGYGDPDQPDVTAFVDEEVAGSPHVALVGASWRTAVYRMVRADVGRRKAPVAKAPVVRSPGAKANPAPRKRRPARS